MKVKSIIIVLIFLITGVGLVHAQSLQALLNAGQSNNLELQVLKNEYLAALEKAPQVSQLPDPEVGIGVFPLPVETRLGAQNARLSLNQMIPWFGSLKSKADLENAKAKALYERVAAKALDLSYNIKKAYYQLYEIQESQAILQRTISIFEALENLALAKVESGTASTADVLRVKLQTAELRQELIITESKKVSPTVTINQLLNRPLDTPISITDNLSFVMLPFKKDSLLTNIQTYHPMLRIFELQKEASIQALEVNRLNGKPTFSLGLDYIMVDQRTDAIPDKNGRDILQLRAGMSIPLNRKKYEAKEREENLIIVALDHKKSDLLNSFLATIEKAYATHETASLRVSLYQQQMEITQTTINILEAAYSTSGRGFDELLSLENELIDFDLKMLKAIIESHLAKAEIERYLID